MVPILITEYLEIPEGNRPKAYFLKFGKYCLIGSIIPRPAPNTPGFVVYVDSQELTLSEGSSIYIDAPKEAPENADQ